MPSFEILCTTMHQCDFSKLKEMNVHSNIIYANQASITQYNELKFESNIAKMITTTTRGCGKNRNIGMIYAEADICLLADDDMIFDDGIEQLVVQEFELFKEADAIIFNVISDNSDRGQVINKKCKRMTKYSRNPYGAFRIAFKLNKIRKCNIWFSTMFGGGAPYPSGEDSLFIRDMLYRGVKIYISDKIIGHVKQEGSTWFNGMNKDFFYGKGAFYAAVHPKTWPIWMLYFAWRTKRLSEMSYTDKIKCMKNGVRGYKDFD